MNAGLRAHQRGSSAAGRPGGCNKFFVNMAGRAVWRPGVCSLGPRTPATDNRAWHE